MLLVAGAALAVSGIMTLLPPAGAIKGWSVLSGSDRKGSTSKEFYSMYDGAAPVMLQAGITSAGQRVYQSGKRRLTVDLYRFKTAAQAKAYYAKRKAEIAGKPGSAASGDATHGTTSAVSGRTIVAYLWGRNCCCTMSVNGKGADEKAALNAFTAFIARKIAAQ